MNPEHDALIQGFLRDELSDEQRNELDRLLTNDPEFAAQFRYEQQQFEALHSQGWSYADPTTDQAKVYKELYESDEIQQIKANLEAAKIRHRSEGTNRGSRRWIWYVSAAVIALCIGVFSWMNRGSSPEVLYSNYIDLTELPSLVERGDAATEKLVEAQQLFEDGNYPAALELLEDERNAIPTAEANRLLYLGIAQMEVAQYDEAIQTFDHLIQSDLLDADKGYWYKALALLKQSKVEAARSVLEYIITEQTFQSRKAELLLDEL